MSKKKVMNEREEEPELLEETKELENDTKLNKEMLKLEEEIQKLLEEKKEAEKKVQLAQAELVNYRKRKDEEVSNTLKYANQDLILELLPIIDNFERALQMDQTSLPENVQKVFVGFQMMYTSFVEILKRYGVEEINRVGEVFDPTKEQALLTDSDPNMDDDVVLEVLLKGYQLKDRVIRPASVKINQK